MANVTAPLGGATNASSSTTTAVPTSSSEVTGAGALDQGALVRGSIVFLIVSTIVVLYLVARKFRPRARGDSRNHRLSQYNMVSSMDDQDDDDDDAEILRVHGHHDEDQEELVNVGAGCDRHEDLLFDASTIDTQTRRGSLAQHSGKL